MLLGGEPVSIDFMANLIGNLDFSAHVDAVEKHGFELLVKRAKIGRAKHVRVRPMFRHWQAVGSLTVLDEEMFGLTEDVIERILTQCGALIGLCDWRPSSPSSGTFGKFEADVEKI